MKRNDENCLKKYFTKQNGEYKMLRKTLLNRGKTDDKNNIIKTNENY